MSDIWQENKTLVGRSLGGAYKDHFLELLETEAGPREGGRLRWQWSATHPTKFCISRRGEPYRGASGIEDDQAAATLAAQKAVDRFPCVRAEERAERVRRGG
jgi:hypothetical protein